MSTFFSLGEKKGSSASLTKEGKEEIESTKKRSNMPKSIKKVVRSFDMTGGGKAEQSPPPKRSNLPKFMGGNGGSTNSVNDSTENLSNDGSEVPKEPRRGSMGHMANKAKNASGQVMRTAVFAPVVAGKAMMQGGVKVVQGGVKAGQLVVDQSVKTTTTIAKTGGKAMVGTSKAFVDGTSSVIDFGGKRLVEGTRGMVKGIKSAATLKGFSIRNMEEKKSKWEKGIEVIESLLEPGSATYDAMTPEQRKELANVKKLLIVGPGGGDKIAHIPRDLIKMKKSESLEVGERRLSSNFILQEFAGVKDVSLLGHGSELDTSESSHPESEDDPSSRRGRSKSPTPRPRAKVQLKKENSNHSLGSLASLQRGFGNLTHDDPELDVANFVPVEFKQMSKDTQMELYNMLSWNSINKWDFDIFRLNKITKQRPLLFIGWAILGSPYAQAAMGKQIGLDYEPAGDEGNGYPFMDELLIPPQKLCEYLRVIELDYRAENPYHNAIHAADVMQSLHTLIQMSLGEEFLMDCPQIKIFTILLSAVIHDVDHPGKTNAFHTGMRTELAIMYNDTSVLENWHVAHAFARLLNIKLTGSNCIHDSLVVDSKRKEEQDKESITNFLCNAHPEQFKMIRNLMIEAVLHTDMTKHFAMVNAAKGLRRQELKEDNTWKVLMFMLHMADISGQAKAAPLFKKWTDRCMSEFFAQGDEERVLGLPISPNCDRNTTNPAESQVGFIKFVVEPAYEVLGMFVPFVRDQVLDIIHDNLDYWVDQMENHDSKGLVVSLDDSSHRIDDSSTSGRMNSSESRNGEAVASHLDESETNGTRACKDQSFARNDKSAGGVEIEA